MEIKCQLTFPIIANLQLEFLSYLFSTYTNSTPHPWGVFQTWVNIEGGTAMCSERESLGRSLWILFLFFYFLKTVDFIYFLTSIYLKRRGTTILLRLNFLN